MSPQSLRALEMNALEAQELATDNPTEVDHLLGEHGGQAVLPSAFASNPNDLKVRTTVLVNLAAIMERMDEQIVPALYKAIGNEFQTTPSQLGMLTLARALVQALSSPLGGFLGQYCNRSWVIALGCFIWGSMTACFSMASSLWQGVLFWGVNGLGLSLVIPNTQSLVADYFSVTSRGRAFGLLYLTGALGGMSGSIYATNLGSHTVLHIQGWRFVLMTVACVSICIGLLNYFFAHDPNYTRDGQRKSVLPFHFYSALQDLWSVVTVPTFLIIVLQGIVGTVPWNALVFLTLYFQLLGMSDLASSTLVALLLGASAFGGMIGGVVGDRAALVAPNHGRILVTQLSVLLGIPGFWIIFKGLPRNGDPATVAVYGIIITVVALVKVWAAPACNNPIFAEIVPQHLRNLVYSFDRCFEGALAAVAAPLVGYVAENVFGFDGAATTSGDREADLAKADALGNALLLFTTLPWTLCLLFYTGLHFTYPRDKRQVQWQPIDMDREGSVKRAM